MRIMTATLVAVAALAAVQTFTQRQGPTRAPSAPISLSSLRVETARTSPASQAPPAAPTPPSTTAPPAPQASPAPQPSAPLSRFRDALPRAAVYHHDTQSEIGLWAVTEAGLMECNWWEVPHFSVQRRRNGWGLWQSHPDRLVGVPPETWKGALPLVRWREAGGLPRTNLFFGYRDAAGHDDVALPFKQGLGRYMGNMRGTPNTRFTPQSAFHWYENGSIRIRVSGVEENLSNGSTYFMQLLWNGTAWVWDPAFVIIYDETLVLGIPLDITLARSVAVGPQAAVRNAETGEEFVFVSAGTRVPGPGAQAKVFCWRRPSRQWENLGAPESRGFALPFVDPPVGLTWTDNGGGLHARVFVTAMHGRGATLYSRELADGCWGDWTYVGFPTRETVVATNATVNGRNVGTLVRSEPLYPVTTAWRLTSGVVWRDAGRLRINLFGHSDGYTDPRTGLAKPGELVSYFFDGSRWQFGESVACPEGVDFKTASSVVVDGLSFDRISVYGRALSGRIWERSYAIDHGRHSGWRWQDLEVPNP